MAFDCVIVGAGPAGMTAAVTLAAHGVRALVLDRGHRSGGQVYRSAASSPLPDASKLGPDYIAGAELITSFGASGAEHVAGADVWHIGEDGRILYSLDGETRQVEAREVLICPGAIERPMPIKGWTLPGVMTAGAAQVMLKSDALVAENAIFAGSGPLLYLIVAQYLRLGVKVEALVDTTPRKNYLQATTSLPGALRSVSLLRKGVSLLAEIRRAGVPVYSNASQLEVLGSGSTTGLSFQSGGLQNVETDTVFLHHGVIPNPNMARALGLDHVWNEDQLTWHVKTDIFGQSSIPHIAVAGDAGAIVGADGARLEGQLAALNILTRLERISRDKRDRLSRVSIRELHRLSLFRRFLDRLYRPTDALRMPIEEDTIVCRCEEQRVSDLREGFAAGARDPNALKSQTRCGMGPCQGRQCGPIVSGLLAGWRGESMDDVGYYRLRSPQRLLSLEELSRFEIDSPPQLQSEEAAQ